MVLLWLLETGFVIITPGIKNNYTNIAVSIETVQVVDPIAPQPKCSRIQCVLVVWHADQICIDYARLSAYMGAFSPDELFALLKGPVNLIKETFHSPIKRLRFLLQSIVVYSLMAL